MEVFGRKVGGWRAEQLVIQDNLSIKQRNVSAADVDVIVGAEHLEVSERCFLS